MQPFAGRGTFLFLRHGETEWNRDRRVMGRLAIPLSAAGRAQLERLTPYLSGVRASSVWTSPLPRAVETAEIAAAAAGAAPISVDDDLSEVDYGDWQGRTFAELLEDPAYHRFHRDPVGCAVPGGETLLEVQKRVLAAMGRIAAQVDGGTAIVVSHGDPIRLVLCECMGIPLPEFRRLRVDNGALSAIEVLGNWVEVKFVNFRPDLEALFGAERDGARAVRETEFPAPGQPRRRGATS